MINFALRFDVVDALMFCLFIYSAENNVSNMSPADEEKIKVCVGCYDLS